MTIRNIKIKEKFPRYFTAIANELKINNSNAKLKVNLTVHIINVYLNSKCIPEL